MVVASVIGFYVELCIANLECGMNACRIVAFYVEMILTLG